MKKLLTWLLCLMMLVSAVPALAYTTGTYTGTGTGMLDKIEVAVSHVEMGQGALTVDCQHVAEFFHVPMSQIRIRNENSDFMPYDEGTSVSYTHLTLPTICSV